MKSQTNIPASAESSAPAEDFAGRVRVNQAKLTSELKAHYDFIVCGSGSSGSVVARRLAENLAVSVLLLEAGGSDDVDTVMDPNRWVMAFGSDLDWGFQAEPNPQLNGRAIHYSMGKV
jgi:choline dehydrogenase